MAVVIKEYDLVKKPGGELSALMPCPQCNRWASLSGHTIEPDGTVRPSLVCPYAGCSFHSYIKLDNWPGIS